MDSPSRLLSNAIQSTEDGSNWGIDNDKSGGSGSRRRRRIEDRFFCAPILLLSPLSLCRAHLYAEDRPTDCDRRSRGRAARFLDRITMSGIMIMMMLELGLGMSIRLLGRFCDLLPCYLPMLF